MFDAPTSTLYNSLNNLLDNPKEYLADVCFTFPSTEIFAHRGTFKRKKTYTVCLRINTAFLMIRI